MWLLFAFLGAICTSLTTILAKIGINNVNSNFATMFRTFIVIICAFLMCLITHDLSKIELINSKNIIFLILSGLATGFSWLCYFKALKIGEVSKVAVIDKSSFCLTSILFLIFFFNDTTNNGNILTIIALIVSNLLIITGCILMINKSNDKSINKKWLIYAILSAVFASLVSLFVKIGLKGIPSNLGTLFRTIIVFIFALLIVLVKHDYKDSSKIKTKSWIFLILSGIATGFAWLFEYNALNMDNSNPVAVNSISKLAILITVLFSTLILKEKLNKKSILGLSILVIGIILIIVFSL